MNQKQLEIKARIEQAAEIFGINPSWAVAIALTESSLGLSQKSPTGCKGVFQMSSVAMKDILNSMEQSDDELTDIFCGVAFLRLLLKRWKTIELATAHFCDPADHYFYIKRVIDYMSLIQNKSNFGG